ncbi:MAG: amylo-alpha-1,6-glucosidase [bacterium]|nr:amylo-alpha-1,6-glucosidase [bacterium]
MRFVYGKQDWRTRERGQENCYLLTNGLGGFSSSTIIGSASRNDHSFLMAAVKAPNHRYQMIHCLKETLRIGENMVTLSSQEYVEKSKNEDGYLYLDSFSFEDYPRWEFRLKGVEVCKSIVMKQGSNLTAVLYQISNRSGQTAHLQITPQLQFVPKGRTLEREQVFEMDEESIRSNGQTLYYRTNGKVETGFTEFCEQLYYAYDACDGRHSEGNTYANHRVSIEMEAHSEAELELVYSMEPITTHAKELLEEEVQYRKDLVKVAGLSHPLAEVLVKAANQFVARRDSTGGKTILAGFPFFEDWGRDTMIAMAGCCISTGQTETAASILRIFASYCKDGLMPNLFPEGENQPAYNTVDASLLFIYAVYLYYKKTGDGTLLEELWPVMADIIKCYQKGTHYGIHMDEDGLLMAGEGLDQVTWMDVRVGERLPTPRHGKPVEINAYWYNALCIMEELGAVVGETTNLAALAKKVKQNFTKKFWNEKKGCLRDVLCGTKAEEQIRCNQIWAVSLPFSLLDPEKERQIVDLVFEKLYTPYGLRTLEMEDEEFRGSYGGEALCRDLAYHQGTVWVFPLGAYYQAYLKVYGKHAQSRVILIRQLEAMESALREGCVGQLPEIYDGKTPTASRGCFAQAWSVGEILRVFEEI